jgi:sialic acid synthase SpsE
MSIIIERSKRGQFVLIAEIGVNYYDIAKKMSISPIEAAKFMILEAKKAGIHAVKFQSYKAETLAVKNSPSYWDTSEEETTSQFELFKKFDSFGEKEYKILSSFCYENNIEFLSTAFDIESADYLYDLMGVYKISSSDLTNHPFVEYQAKKGKPILLSTGASNEDEIEQTLRIIRKYNNHPIILLHCVLEYPTPNENANLNRIPALKNKFSDLIIGYSDHTKPDKNMDILKTAYNLGALVIEKHYTLDKTLPGNDHYHAMDPIDATKVIDDIDFIEQIRGSYNIDSPESEEVSRKNARRSLVALTDIKKNSIITSQMLTFKRPGTGVSPSEINNVIGKIAKVDIKEDTILKYEMFHLEEGSD